MAAKKKWYSLTKDNGEIDWLKVILLVIGILIAWNLIVAIAVQVKAWWHEWKRKNAGLFIGDAPQGYTETQAAADIKNIVVKLGLDSTFNWPFALPDLSYLTNDDEPGVIEIFKRNKGEYNKYMERRWNFLRKTEMLAELATELNATEYDTVVEELNKTP
jgi:hypothetical protein